MNVNSKDKKTTNKKTNTRCEVYGEEKSECKMPVFQSVVFFFSKFYLHKPEQVYDS